MTASVWIYFLGEREGQDIKIGRSGRPVLRGRLASVNGTQTTSASYLLLAGVRGTPKDEKHIQRYFSHLNRTDKGRHTEYYRPGADLAEYINWLRQWWWVTIDPDEPQDDLELVEPELWLPREERRTPCPPSEPGMLIQRYRDLEGPLAGTPWDWMLAPKQSIQDYFTPPEIIEAARTAMGGLDLDAASHPLANRIHRIPDYFHVNRSAFDHDWYGRVWLNPPYGNNAPWFERVLHYLDVGTVTQLCILSPMWAFTTAQARPLMRRSSATVLLSPTPTFWGNEATRTGSNHPHGIVYFGERVDEFVAAFAPYGIPAEIAWDRVPV